MSRLFKIIFYALLTHTLLFGETALFPIPTIVAEYGTETGFDLGNYRRDYDRSFKFDKNKKLDLKFRNDSLFVTSGAGMSGYYPVNFEFGKEPHTLMIKIKPTENVSFQYPEKDGVQDVFVMGNFNDWNRTSHRCTKSKSGYWQSSVYLRPGKYEYKFVVDKAEILDPANLDSLPNGLGGFNNILVVGDPEKTKPGKYIKIEYSKSGNGITLVYKYQKNYINDMINSDNFWLLFNNELLDKRYYELIETDLIITLPQDYQEGLLRICAVNEKGELIIENHTIIIDGEPLNCENQPDDWHFGIIYSLLIDRFVDGNPKNTVKVVDDELHPLANFQGGDLAGIIQKIESGYFDDLGINALWITPVAKVPDDAYTEYIEPQRKFTGYHGYWPVEPRKIDPRWGTKKEFKKMVSTAHEHGIKVLLDFVSNHTHELHPYYKKHRDWYGQLEMADGSQNLRNWSGETMLTTWFDTFLPSFDYTASDAAIDAVVSDAVYWIKEYDLDGFRQDATKHVPHKFWKQLTRTLYENFPDKEIYQIGESFGSDNLIGSFVNPSELSSQFNFGVYFPARRQFAGNDPNFIELNDVIYNNIDFFQPVNLMGLITSSHDQVRFMGLADRQITFDENGVERAFTNPPVIVFNKNCYDKLLMFSVMNMSLPGVPVVYYGEEIGQIGANDPDNRRMMRFDNELSKIEKELKLKMSKMINLRRTNPALSLGDLTVLYEDKNASVWEKRYFDDRLIIFFNNSKTQKSISIPLDDKFTLMQGISLLDRGMIIPVGNKLTLTLNPYEVRIFEVK